MSNSHPDMSFPFSPGLGSLVPTDLSSLAWVLSSSESQCIMLGSQTGANPQGLHIETCIFVYRVQIMMINMVSEVGGRKGEIMHVKYLK